MESLEQTDYFDNLNKRMIQFLAERCEIHLYVPSDFIIVQGAMVPNLIVLTKGTVDITIGVKNPHTVATLQPFSVVGLFFLIHDIFGKFSENFNCVGDISFFLKNRASANVVAATFIEILVITKENFELFVKQYPEKAAEYVETKFLSLKRLYDTVTG